MNERIVELKRKRHALLQEMKAIVAKETDDTPLSDEDRSRFDELKESIDSHDERIGRLEDMVSAEGGDEVDDDKAFTAAVQKSNVAIINKKNRSHEPKGTMMARFVIGAGMAKQHGRDAGVQYVRDNLEDLEVSKALNATGTSAAGGLLVPQDYRQEIIDLLWAETVVRSSNPQTIPLPMGQITIPRLATSSQATWIGEQDDISVSTPSFDQIVMQARKLAGLVPVQNDLIRRSPLAVESIVRSQMVKQISRSEDAAFLTGSGSSGVPKGLLNLALAANVSTSTTAPSLSVVNNVLSGMQLKLLGNNIPDGRAVWFMNPQLRSYLATLTDSVGRYFFQEELGRGILFGYPYKMTTNLAANLLSNGTPVTTTLSSAATATNTLAVASSAAFAKGMQVSGTGISAVTTITDIADGTHITTDVPVTMASGATLTGSYVTSALILAAMDQVLFGDTLEMFADSSDVASYYDGSNTISTFQRDQTIFRVIEEVDLNVQHPAAIAVTNVFNWLPTNTTPQGAVPYSTQTATYPASPSLSATPQ